MKPLVKITGYILCSILLVMQGLAQDESVRLEFSDSSAVANQVTLLGAGFGQYPQAQVDFGVIPTDQDFPGATDGQHAVVTANPGEGVAFYVLLITCCLFPSTAGAITTSGLVTSEETWSGENISCSH